MYIMHFVAIVNLPTRLIWHFVNNLVTIYGNISMIMLCIHILLVES